MMIGHYEILAKVGAGGMGEVYRARDTKLNRDVAIKVLPDVFARDPDRLARFAREAQTLASLNHPHIAHIYGVEDRALVMEFVEGEDLAQRIARGAVPVDEAIVMARQVADALEAAHGRGIVHRDLKPANVKVAPDGTVKVLDFGLAKAIAPDPALPGMENSPTFTSPAMTQIGVILGTAAYMAPEQAKGRAVDRRADLWAFGCLLYEMLTGRRAFPGEDVTDTIALIMRGEPDWALLPRDLPPVVAAYLRRCLQKNPRDRVQDAGDLRLALSGAFDPPGSDQSPPRGRSRWALPAMAAAALVLAALAAAAAWQFKPAPANASQRTRRFTITPGPATLAVATTNRDVAITPDGTAVIYIAGQGSARQFYIRRMDATVQTALGPALRCYEPIVSPDGQWVAFNDEADYTLRKMSLAGGPPMTVAPVGGEVLGATWGSDDTIVYATDQGLWRVPAAGGTPVRVAKPDASRGEVLYAWPEFLTDATTVLFTIRSTARGGDVIAARDLRSGTTKVIVRGATGARYSRTGHLLYVADGTIRAVRFNRDTLQVEGEAVVIAQNVDAKARGAGDFALSGDGTLVYVNGGAAAAQRRLVWIDRDGRRQPIDAPLHAYAIARISPDGTRAALDVRDQQSDIWIWDFKGERLTRFTTDPSFDGLPVWLRDGRRIVFGSNRQGGLYPFVQAADGTGEPQLLFETSRAMNPTSVTPDGKLLILRRDAGQTSTQASTDIVMGALDDHAQPRTLLGGSANELNGEVSPDGRWLAYESDESGTFEVYVRPFPQVQEGRWQISNAGGVHPAWQPDGRGIYYVDTGGRLRLASWTITPGPSVGAPTVLETPPLYEGLAPRSFDISPDGRRILVIEPANAGPADAPSMTVVLNWLEEVKRRGVGGPDR
jgi:Tol biopolymer transport system component/predicted Ser/Thr protein kinase